MALLLILALFMAMTSHSSANYCLCKDGVGDSAYQKAIDYACGQGGDCTSIQQSGACYQPNTIKAHCDYAVNSYFQKKGQASGTCDFSGAATPSVNPPTNVASGCSYPSSPSNTGTPTTGTPTTGTPTTGTPTTGTPTTATPTGTPSTSTGTTTGTPSTSTGTGTGTGTTTGTPTSTTGTNPFSTLGPTTPFGGDSSNAVSTIISRSYWLLLIVTLFLM